MSFVVDTRSTRVLFISSFRATVRVTRELPAGRYLGNSSPFRGFDLERHKASVRAARVFDVWQPSPITFAIRGLDSKRKERCVGLDATLSLFVCRTVVTIYSRDRESSNSRNSYETNSVSKSREILRLQIPKTFRVSIVQFLWISFRELRARIFHDPVEKEGECVLVEVGHPFLRSVSNFPSPALVQLLHRPRQHGSMPRPDEPRHPVYVRARTHARTHTHTHTTIFRVRIPTRP